MPNAEHAINGIANDIVRKINNLRLAMFIFHELLYKELPTKVKYIYWIEHLNILSIFICPSMSTHIMRRHGILPNDTEENDT